MVHLVFTGRNDTHGGGRFSEKMIEILDWNVRMFRRHDLEHMFWFVEWGKDAENGWLSPELAERYPTCRCIMVPNDIVSAAQEYPVRFQELAAKNVGIARAKGGLVIATNSDVLFSDALTRYLKDLVPNDMHIYRAPRQDFKCDGPLPEDEKDFDLTTMCGLGAKCGEAAGDFTAATPESWEMLKGYSESKRHMRSLDSEVVVKAMQIGMLPMILPTVYHKEHPESTKFEDKWRYEWGDYDRDLVLGNKIMPRGEIWGHRDCVLIMEGERLSLMAEDKWYIPDEPDEPENGEVSDDAPEVYSSPLHEYLVKSKKLNPEQISNRPCTDDLAYTFFFRESLGQLLNRGDTVSVGEFKSSVNELQRLIKAPDLPKYIAENRDTFSKLTLAMLVIKLRSEIMPGEEKLIDKLERAYGLLTSETDTATTKSGPRLIDAANDCQSNEKEFARTLADRLAITHMLNRNDTVSPGDYKIAVEALDALIDAEDLHEYIKDNRATFPQAMVPALIIRLRLAVYQGSAELAVKLEKAYGLLTWETVKPYEQAISVENRIPIGTVPQQEPYLSIVVGSRNDDHGGNMLERMQASINTLLAQSKRYQLRTELIVVDWNPVPDRPKLSEALSWPEDHDFCTIRFIEVPLEIHNRYDYSDLQNFYQMIAKNVGIRRARGLFVLATNIDIIFSNELFAFFASGKMTRDKLYRANRWDVKEDIPLNLPVDEQLGHCYKNIIRINTAEKTYDLLKDKTYLIYLPDRKYESIPLDTNGCGDFQLMWRGHWCELNGYPEFHMFSFHLDSMFEYMAHYAGFTEETLQDPLVMFHIEHASIMPLAETDDQDLRKKVKGIREFSLDELDELACRMALENRPIIFNDQNWGLALDDLVDYCVLTAKWDRWHVGSTSNSGNPGDSPSGVALGHPVGSF